jgi:uncharacterized protein YegP (UPF0339 family)
MTYFWSNPVESLRANQRGIYFDEVQRGLSQDDFVVYKDHRGRYRVDLVTTRYGNHLTLGKTAGEATQRDAIRLAEKEAHRRGFLAPIVVDADRDYQQLGSILDGRFTEGG